MKERENTMASTTIDTYHNNRTFNSMFTSPINTSRANKNNNLESKIKNDPIFYELKSKRDRSKEMSTNMMRVFREEIGRVKTNISKNIFLSFEQIFEDNPNEKNKEKANKSIDIKMNFKRNKCKRHQRLGQSFNAKSLNSSIEFSHNSSNMLQSKSINFSVLV